VRAEDQEVEWVAREGRPEWDARGLRICDGRERDGICRASEHGEAAGAGGLIKRPASGSGTKGGFFPGPKDFFPARAPVLGLLFVRSFGVRSFGVRISFAERIGGRAVSASGFTWFYVCRVRYTVLYRRPVAEAFPFRFLFLFFSFSFLFFDFLSDFGCSQIGDEATNVIFHLYFLSFSSKT
jgi:hypothetical protein